MRALIFELRPEALEREGLVAALAKQAAALQARYDLSIRTELCEEPALPLKVKQELYRIAQEALHNTVKHARARTVDLMLRETANAVILEVGDDGVGFDPLGHFQAIWDCARCRSVSGSWAAGLRSRALRGKEPTFSRRFRRGSRLGMGLTIWRGREEPVQRTPFSACEAHITTKSPPLHVERWAVHVDAAGFP
jgi:hypothetical protein